MLHLPTRPALLAGLAAMLTLSTAAARDLVADPHKHCEWCEGWNQPFEPVHVFGNVWHVGTAGLGAVLITSKEGHILIDGGLPQTAPLIAENIRKTGFRVEDVKLLLNSHTHYDHAGGLAALQRASGAPVAASPAAKLALQAGGALEDDPQFGFGAEHNAYPAVRGEIREVRDGETLKVGPLAITVHFTPGHTPGGTSWSWKSCEGERCLNFVYADSLNSVSSPEFRFSDDAKRVAVFEKSISTVEQLPCDVLLAAHPNFVDLERKVAEAKTGKADVFVDPQACRNYAAGARERLRKRLAEERAARAAD